MLELFYKKDGHLEKISELLTGNWRVRYTAKNEILIYVEVLINNDKQWVCERDLQFIENVSSESIS